MQQLGQVGAELDINHPIDLLAPGQIQHGLPPLGFAMINHRLSAGFPAR